MYDLFEIDREIDEINDTLPLGYSPSRFVVVMVSPRCWDVVEDYDGIEDDYGNMSGVFRDKRPAEDHARSLNY